MKGSTKAGVNPVKLGGAGRGTTVANTGFKSPGVAKAKVSPNQNLNLKKRAVNSIGVVQGMKNSIHKNRGGSAMKAIFRGKA